MINTPHQSTGPPPLSISGQIGHFIKWKHAKRRTVLLHEAGYLLLGLVLLATVTGLYFWLDVPLVSAAFTYLVVLVLLSLVSNLYHLQNGLNREFLVGKRRKLLGELFSSAEV